MVDIGGSHRLLRHSKMKSERALRLIESGKVPFRGGGYAWIVTIKHTISVFT